MNDINTIDIELLISKLNITKSEEKECIETYKKSFSSVDFFNKSKGSLPAAVVYRFCKENQKPINQKEIFDNDSNSYGKKEFNTAYKRVLKMFPIKMKVIDPEVYIARLSSELKLSPETHSRSISILNKVKVIECCGGRSPIVIAASALYIASLLNGEKRRQWEIADVAGVTKGTIRNTYKEILEKCGLEEKYEE